MQRQASCAQYPLQGHLPVLICTRSSHLESALHTHTHTHRHTHTHTHTHTEREREREWEREWESERESERERDNTQYWCHDVFIFTHLTFKSCTCICRSVHRCTCPICQPSSQGGPYLAWKPPSRKVVLLPVVMSAAIRQEAAAQSAVRYCMRSSSTCAIWNRCDILSFRQHPAFTAALSNCDAKFRSQTCKQTKFMLYRFFVRWY